MGLAEYPLANSIFAVVSDHWGKADRDMFAGRWNKKTKNYCTLDPMDREATAIDCLAMEWTRRGKETLYAFPPPQKRVIVQAIKMALGRKTGKTILILPLWPTLPWALLMPHLANWPVVWEGTQETLNPPPSYRSAGTWREKQWWKRATWNFWIGLCLSADADSKERITMAAQLQKSREQRTNKEQLEYLENTLMQSGVGSMKPYLTEAAKHKWLSQTLLSAT